MTRPRQFSYCWGAFRQRRQDRKSMNSLKALHEYGQSPWLDFMRRTLIGAELQTMIERDGLGGITSNPSIFEKAIGQSSD
jgi:hypothetical protein